VTPPPTPADGLLAALAGLTAYRGGLDDEVLAMGAEMPGFSFAGAVALAARLAEELRAAGGDPDLVTAAAYQACAPAPS
jgi:hypothetical protein